MFQIELYAAVCKVSLLCIIYRLCECAVTIPPVKLLNIQTL